MRLAASDLSKLLWTSKSSVKSIALLLSRSILPIGAVGMAEGTPSIMYMMTRLQLIGEALVGREVSQKFFGFFTPKDNTVLHARARDASDLCEITSLLFQSV